MVSRRTVLIGGATLAGLAAAGYAAWPKMGGYEAFAASQREFPPPDADLAELVRMATLAANSHNTQPWQFMLGGEQVSILPDGSRRTPVVDPDDHHLFVSLGCAAENMVQAAPALGRRAEVAFEGGAEPRIAIDLVAGPTVETPLYKAIPLRQSTRANYDGQPLSVDELALLREAARQEGVALEIFTERDALEAILGFIVEANSAQIDDPAFVAELREWIRFTPADALATRDGLFAATSGNPVVPAWLAGAMFNAFFTKDAENAKYSDHLRSSAGVAVFIAEREDPDHWVRVGRSFQRFALQATTLGIRTAHLNQPVEVAAIRPQFADWLGIPGRRPDLVIRFGRGPTLPMSLRRTPQQVIVSA